MILSKYELKPFFVQIGMTLFLLLMHVGRSLVQPEVVQVIC